MGQSSSFELYGWKINGKPLPVSAKREIQDVVFETGVDEYGTDCNEKDSFIMSFGSEYYGAYDSACKALSEYAQAHDDALIELYYDCEEANEYHCIRFRGNETEEYDRVEIYPPFARLTRPDDDHQLPVLEFHFDSMDDSPYTSILVLLDRHPSADVLKGLEDSIASYADSMHRLDFKQLIHDVLSAEGIGHWIITPTHTFHI